MLKIILPLLLFLGLQAKMIDAIAVVVNNEPITLYEIQKASVKLHIPPKDALQLLIRQKLEDEQIKKMGIDLSDSELEQAIENFAKSKGLSYAQLYNYLSQRGEWESFKEGLKKNLLQKKLYKRIIEQNLMRDEQSLKEYYEAHKERFMRANAVDVVKYISPSKKVLERIKQNPLYRPDESSLLQTGKERIELSKVDPNFAYLLQTTPQKSFTDILPIGKNYLLLYIEKKENPQPIPFEEARNMVLQMMARENSDKLIKEYFDRLKAASNIKVLRLP